jgi:hypothetical protein
MNRQVEFVRDSRADRSNSSISQTADSDETTTLEEFIQSRLLGSAIVRQNAEPRIQRFTKKEPDSIEIEESGKVKFIRCIVTCVLYDEFGAL